jgi:tetratricopeptide (TPR) repeat protein
VTDGHRLEELRRRVVRDPASIAFAALAEEYRRAERFREAIETCRAGLRRHPVYLSARVTLGRALLEVGDYEGARQELERVLQVAPDNLAALQALGEINRRLEGISPGHSPSSLSPLTSANPPDTIGTVPAPRPTESPGRPADGPDAAAIAGLEQLLEGIRRARAALEASEPR